MTSVEAFKKFQVELNKVDTEDNIDISPGEFVLIYNKWQNKWFEKQYRNKSTRYVDDVQQLINTDKILEKSSTNEDFSEFKLPSDYFDYIRSNSIGSTDSCKRNLYNIEVKIINLDLYLNDEYHSPSFEYKQTIVFIASDKIRAYKKGFEIDNLLLTYYRYPKQIDIEGYIRIDQTESTNIDPELSDNYVDEIIDMCVTDVQRIYENGDGFNLSQNRENNNI